MSENVLVPPYANRGVQNTERSALRACVDWVQVTLKIVQDLQKIFDLLGYEKDDFSVASSSRYGYKRHLRNGHISILYDHATHPGFHLEFTGQGCREYEVAGKKNWRELFSEFLALDGNFTRLDAAIDDIAEDDQKPYFTLNTLYRKVKEGAVTSKFKRGKYIESFLIDDGSGLGETLYFGRDQSDMQIRFYEKDLERIENGAELETCISAWNRTEIQTRDCRAQALAIRIVNDEDLGKIVSGVLRNYINFRIKDKEDSNKARWKVCKWWDDFLGDAEKLKLTFIAPDRTVERTKAWIDKQVTPALATILMAHGGDYGVIDAMIEDGLQRMTDEQHTMADEYFEKVLVDREEYERLKRQSYQLMMFRTVDTHKKNRQSLMVENDENSAQFN